MKICAIICEYNPMHLGHSYQIEKARELSGADYIMCIMSSNFCQRGLPAILDKYTRAKIALECGADIVVAIPTADSISCAEIYALAGIKIANSFDSIDSICFGAECDDIESLKKLANFLVEPNKEYLDTIDTFLKSGFSMPGSITKSLIVMSQRNIIDISENTIKEIMLKPNNILAIEYLKALNKTKSNIKPIIIKREDNYHSDKVKNKFASATLIRNLIEKSPNKIKKYVPDFCYNEIKNHIKMYGNMKTNRYYDISLFSLKKASITKLHSIADIPQGLENRIHEKAISTNEYLEYLNKCNSKLYTTSRLNRISTSVVLDIIESDHITLNKDYDYIKVLSFKNDSQLLSSLKCSSKVILRSSDAKKYENARQNEIETRANNIYSILFDSPLTINNDIFTLPYIKK